MKICSCFACKKALRGRLDHEKACFQAFSAFFLFTSLQKLPYDEGALEAGTF